MTRIRDHASARAWRPSRSALTLGLLASPGLAVAGEPSYAQDPAGIIDGELVEECGYASVGSYGIFPGELVCSLTLIAPDVVLTATHCLELGGVPTEVQFGEDHASPEKIVPVEFCETRPGYDDEWGDIAFCVLAEPVLDIPITPIATNCELSGLAPGNTVDIVGFGMDELVGDPNFPQPQGGGIKRSAPQIVEQLVKPLSQIWMLGMDDVSACFGDSGGPVMVRLPDGQVRVAGVGQQLHPDSPTGTCGYGVIYQAAFPHLPWLEARTGRDLTPCWDGGDWDPGPGCVDFAIDPHLALGTWAQGCVGGGLSGPVSEQCGEPQGPGEPPEPPEPPEPEPPDPEPTTTGDGDGDPEPPGPPDPATGDGDGDPDPDPMGGSDDTGGTGAGVDWAPERGCGCGLGAEASPAPGSGWLAGLGLVALFGLRRRRARHG